MFMCVRSTFASHVFHYISLFCWRIASFWSIVHACLRACVYAYVWIWYTFMCAYNGFPSVQDVIYPVRSPIHTHAHINTTRSVCSGMRLIYLWTHVKRAHVHVYQMNFIGLCARLCMATPCLCVCACLCILCLFSLLLRFQHNDTFNWNWQMNLSSIYETNRNENHIGNYCRL